MKKFKRQQYERPLTKYKCGRAACWDKPCFNGPKPDGSCGGTVECTPLRKGDRWECCRPAIAGGPCTNGPLPDGRCSQTRPPCVPVLTFRERRGRVVMVLCGIVLASILCWFHFGGTGGRIAAVQPGPLSSRHQHLAMLLLDKDAHSGATTGGGDDMNCKVCHRAHAAGAAGWIAAAFQKSRMSQQCLACHRFADPANQELQNTEHNQIFPNREKAAKTECQLCHTEHHGLTASLIAITDSQCNTCHSQQIHSFSKDHPQFPNDFPLGQVNAVRFDHNKHQSAYFKQKNAQFVCAECHKAASVEKQMETGTFEDNCARCHLANIQQNDLAILRLDVANPTSTPFNKLLFSDGKGAKTFFADLSKNGNALATRLQAATGVADPKSLLLGLDVNAVKTAAALMVKSADNANNITGAAGLGWFWNSDNDDSIPELHYRATAHADPVMRAWLDLSVKSPSDFQKAVLNRTKGPGSCTKCHVTTAGDTMAIGWKFPPLQIIRHTTFSHRVHLKLKDCQTCHQLNPEANLAAQFTADANIVHAGVKPVSSFNSIKIQTCTECHAEKKISQDCFLCHRYHKDPTYKHPGEIMPTLQVINRLPPSTPVVQNSPPAPPDAAAKQQADEAARAQAAKDQAARDQAAKDQAAKEQASRDQAARDLAAKDKAAKDQAAKDQAARDQAARDQAARDQATKDQAAKDQAAKEQAARDAAAANTRAISARDQEAKDRAARDQVAKDAAAKEQAAKDQAARDQAARDQTARDQAAREQAARDQAAREQAAKPPPPPPVVVASISTPAPTPAVASAVSAHRQTYHGAFIGNQECISCHGPENEVWAATKHNKSWDLRRLAGKPPVSTILSAVGSTQRRPTDEPICANCHFTVVDSKPALGVSCESCHGAASDWKDIHNNRDKIPDKTPRMQAARDKGMIGPGMKQDLVQNCFGCHNYDSGKVSGDTIAKMLGAGHPEFAFEFVAFSQGTIRHRFYPPDASVNAQMTPAELARWYVIGQGAQMVSSARVIAASPGVDVVKSNQQAKIDTATKALNATGLPEARALISAPSDDTLAALIAATDGKDFTAQVGGMVPTSFK